MVATYSELEKYIYIYISKNVYTSFYDILCLIKGGVWYMELLSIDKFAKKVSVNVVMLRNKLVVGYCRVSTPSQKDNLENQILTIQINLKRKNLQMIQYKS